MVDFLAFTPDDVARALDAFTPLAGQYVFISSASAYQKPPGALPVTESAPLENRHWQYSRDKIACEARLEGAALPVTIVRPSLTYDQTMVPLVLNAWTHPYTVVDRMRRGKKVIVPGDGSSVWTVTHSEDFARGLAGLLGNPDAYGEDFHITSDEWLTWDRLYALTAAAAGADFRPVHIASDWLVACVPEWEGTLLGDKIHSAIFDNAKLRRLVPDFVARIPFADGIRDSVAWCDADPARREVDAELDARHDALIAQYESARDAAAARWRSQP